MDGIVDHVPVRLFGVSGWGGHGREERGLQQQAGLTREELLMQRGGTSAGDMKVHHEAQKQLKDSLLTCDNIFAREHVLTTC